MHAVGVRRIYISPLTLISLLNENIIISQFLCCGSLPIVLLLLDVVFLLLSSLLSLLSLS
eukprot:m.7386 g.7386  ORF g.7386 m.7386 type:complete len:60 (-) comp2788_c0_seq1:90-269(-)